MRSASIQGKVALVTGASAGIGEATARALAEEGAHLILFARRAERLAALAADVTASHPGVKVHVVSVDVRDADAVKAAVAAFPADLAAVDILVNNAGLALGKDPAHAVEDADLTTMVETNCVALARLTRLIVPGMVARDAGHVVNMSSVAAHHHYPGGSVYCGCKAWVDAYTNALRCDLVATNVRVTAVAPGAVKTEEFGAVRFKGNLNAANAVYEGYDPLTAADCADAVLYAVTRPPNCCVGEVVLWANRQATPTLYGRR